jgi:tetrahydromethanopterin S-methyltransferase subunit F
MSDSDSENNQGNNNQGNNNQGNNNQGNNNQGNNNQGNNNIQGNTDVSGNPPTSDISGGVTYDISGVTYTSPQIVTDLSSTTITGTGYEIEHAEGKDEDGDDLKKTTFDTTEPELYDPQIHQDLNQTIETYNDMSGVDLSGNLSQTSALFEEIKDYASQLQCSDFHGKGSIEDYNALFEAASRIANDTKQIELDVDMEGFNEFAQAADDLSSLFEGFILKLSNVSVITDVNFLTSVVAALKRIVNLSETFGRFKQTVFSTSAIQLPKSAFDTKVVLDGVMDEINCAMQYIDHFVNPTDPSLNEAALSPEEKEIIQKSVDTIDNWNNMAQYGVTIAMSNDENIQCIQQYSQDLKVKKNSLVTASASLRAKLAAFNIIES